MTFTFVKRVDCYICVMVYFGLFIFDSIRELVYVSFVVDIMSVALNITTDAGKSVANQPASIKPRFPVSPTLASLSHVQWDHSKEDVV